MTSLFDLDNSSDSDDDFDYAPPACELSSSEDEPLPSSDDEMDKNRKRSSKTVSESEKKVPVDESKPVTGSEEKKKANDVYQNFLNEIAAEMKDSSRADNEPVTSAGMSYSESASSSVVLGSEKKPMCVSPESSSISTAEKLFDFAGETVCVVDGTVKPVESDSSIISSEKTEKAAPDAEATALPLVKRKKGLESVLGAIQNKKSKMTVMQKSMLDWKTWKKQEGIDEELEQFNRGKGGFIERQRFLERSDVRSYEIERDMRLSKRHTQPKRDT